MSGQTLRGHGNKLIVTDLDQHEQGLSEYPIVTILYIGLWSL